MTEQEAYWTRLRILKSLSKEQMESMLAYLSGRDANAWDEALDHSGNAQEECIHPNVFANERGYSFCMTCGMDIPNERL